MSLVHYKEDLELSEKRNFSLVDYSLIFLSGILIMIGVMELYFHQDKPVDFRNLLEIAKVSDSKAGSQRKITGTLTWAGLRKGMPVYKGDYVLTDSESEIDLTFKDKTFLHVPSDSLVKIDFSDNSFDLELIKGVVDITMSKGVDKINIRKGKEKLTLKGDEGKVKILKQGRSLRFKTKSEKIRLFEDANGKQRAREELLQRKEPLLASSRTLKISPGQKELNIPLGRQTNGRWLLAGSKSFSKSKGSSFSGNLVRFKRPAPGDYYFKIKEKDGFESETIHLKILPFAAPVIVSKPGKKTMNLGEPLTFEWKNMSPGKFVVQARLKSGQGKSFKTRKNSLKLVPKRNVNYMFRVRVDEPGSLWSPWGEYDITLKSGLAIEEKIVKPVIKMKSKRRFKANLAVKPEKHKGLYTYTLASDPDMKNVLMKKKLKSNKTKVDIKKPGRYFWKVEKQSGKRVKKTTIQSLLVQSAVAEVDKKNFKDEQVSTEKRDHKIGLRWKKILKEDVLVQVSKTPDFSEPLFEKSVKSDKVDLKVASLGTYYWRVLPDNKTDTEVWLPSQTYKVTTALPPVLGKPKIRKQQIIKFKVIKNVDSHEITLPEQDFAVYYLLEVYKDKKLTQPVFKKRFKGKRGYWVSERSGRYYYRLRIEDKWGRLGPYSDVGELIFPISPLTEL